MEVWIFEIFDPEDDSIAIDVYSKQEEAYQIAFESCKNVMQDQGIDSATHVFHNYYERFNECLSKKLYSAALLEYSSFQNELDRDERIYFSVYRKSIMGDEITANAHVADPSKPCKSCKRIVTESEAICWWCGCSNPGK